MLTRLIPAWGGIVRWDETGCAARLLGSICFHFLLNTPFFSAYGHSVSSGYGSGMGFRFGHGNHKKWA
jgi:hypothetical protein